MRYAILFISILLIIFTSSSVTFPAETKEFSEQLFSLPEEQIDIGHACLLFAREVYPDLDVDEYSRKIYQMVSEIQKYTRDTGDPDNPDHRIR